MTGPQALAQLMGVGLVWMSVHCVGMCGPLLTGLDISAGATWTGVSRTLQYQSGRAISYALLGALAGLVGDGLGRVSGAAGAVVAVVLGGVALGKAAGVRWPTRERSVQIGRRKPRWTKRIVTGASGALTALMQSRHPARPFVLGMVLAFMPCMIALWALGLASLTASPLWGAVVMLTLVAMTTPLLVGVGLFSGSLRSLPGWRDGRPQRVLLALAGTWLVLVGLAGAGVIAHAHVPLHVGDRSFMLMLY
jgi:hypothetical protein